MIISKVPALTDFLLAHFNQRILSKDNLLGLLGGFGVPDLN